MIYLFNDTCSQDTSLCIHNTTFDSNIEVSLHIHANTNVEMTGVDITKTVNKIGSQPRPYVGALRLICTDYKQTVRLSNIRVTNNNMTGLWLQGCQVEYFKASSVIANNKSPDNGGGMYINNKTFLSSTITVYLVNNTATTQYGDAIYSTANIVSPSVNLMCSFYSFDVRFLGNYAKIAGNDIYGGYYYIIDVFNAYLPHFIVVYCYYNIHNLGCLPLTRSSISSVPFGACVCINNSYIDCTQRFFHSEVYHGETITLSCDSWDVWRYKY